MNLRSRSAPARQRHAGQGDAYRVAFTAATAKVTKRGALETGCRCRRANSWHPSTADFLPEPDFLRRTIPYFMNPDGGAKIGMVQTALDLSHSDDSLANRLWKRFFFDGHFRRRARRAFPARHVLNFQRHAGVWRRKAIDDARRLGARHAPEDTDLLIALSIKGLEFLLFAAIELRSELPWT